VTTPPQTPRGAWLARQGGLRRATRRRNGFRVVDRRNRRPNARAVPARGCRADREVPAAAVASRFRADREVPAALRQPGGRPPPPPPNRQQPEAKKRRSLLNPQSLLLIAIIVVALVAGGLAGAELYARHRADNILVAVAECVVEDRAAILVRSEPALPVAARHRSLHEHLGLYGWEPSPGSQGG